VLVHLGAQGPVGWLVEHVEDIVEAVTRRGDGPEPHAVVDGRILSLVDLDRLAPRLVEAA